MKKPEILCHDSALASFTRYPPGSKERAKALGLSLWLTYGRVDATLKEWEETERLADQEQVWKPLGLKSLDDLILQITGKSRSAVQKELNKRGGQPGNQNASKQPKGNEGANGTLVSRGSNQSAYLLARIARDRPDILARYEAGEFSSVRQAAIEAGIVKVPAVLDGLLKLWAKAPAKDRRSFLETVGGKAVSKRPHEPCEFGPRNLKEPTSRGYAIQTLRALKRYLASKDVDEQRVAEELSRIEKYRHWEVLGYKSKSEMFNAEGIQQPDCQDVNRPSKPPTHRARHGSVTIDYGKPEATESPFYRPQTDWPELVSLRRYFAALNIPYLCRSLLQFIREADKMWQPLGYTSADDLIDRGYELSPDDIRIALEWLRLWKPEEVEAIDKKSRVVVNTRPESEKRNP